ncbi:hypothetical protein U14_00042 [Candidatus Moduliflexus flocculans]|uniref:Uncharacterized protein n=1 Tax=Candidatus Moduliflexus flocculans TaxID=1499966 RepID=A0A0S6VT26_9BACT|nr:hypothetical protein U14_00042 [Candidatus Moduliflexus flocculans]
MIALQFEIEDQLIQTVGLKTVKEFLERQLALLRLTYLGDMISQTIRESGIDYQEEIEQARQEAWQAYKSQL